MTNFPLEMKYVSSFNLFSPSRFTKMSESTKIDNELTKNAVEIRQIIQDFPLCSTFREIDDQNALGKMQLC